MQGEDGARSRSRLLVYGAVLIAVTGLGIGFAFGAGSAGPATSAALALGGCMGLLLLGERWTAEGRLAQLVDGGRIEFHATLGHDDLAEPCRSQVRELLTLSMHDRRYMMRLPVDLMASETTVHITSRPIGGRRAGAFSLGFGLSEVLSVSTSSPWHDQAGPGLTFDLQDGSKICVTIPLSAKQMEVVAGELRRRVGGRTAM